MAFDVPLSTGERQLGVWKRGPCDLTPLSGAAVLGRKC